MIGFVRIVLWEWLFHTYGPHYVGVGLTVGISLLGVVLWGTLAGSMLPFILRRLGFDPASASAPFVATLVDVVRSGHLLHGGGGHPGGDVALTSALQRGPLAVLILSCPLLAACDDDLPEPEPPNPVEIDESANTGCPPLPPISGFVGRGDAALLLDSVTPFRATGTNLYYLQQLLSYAQQDQDPQALQAVGEVLDDLVCLSLPVARIWGFNDSKDTSSIRRSPQEGFREQGLRGLDQAVWEAKRRGIRVIIPLVNNWGEYGGLPAYAAWASATFGGTYAHDDFYTNAQMKQWWKDYAYHARDAGQHVHRRPLPRRTGDPRLGDRQRDALFQLRGDDQAPSTRSPSWRRS